MKDFSWRQLLLCLLTAARLGAAELDNTAQTLAPAEMKADLDCLVSTFDEVHPNLYFKVSRERFADDRRDVESKLSQPLTVVEFYQTLKTFVAGFADGHTAIFPPSGVHFPDKNGGPARPNYHWKFEILPGAIGHLDFVDMDSPLRSDWQKFLLATFRTVQEKHLTGLIVDLRNNDGGDSNLGDDLLDYLADKPYRMASRKEWKFSRRYLTSPASAQFFADAESMTAKLKDQPESADETRFFALNPNPSPAIKQWILAHGSTVLKARLAKFAPRWL